MEPIVEPPSDSVSSPSLKKMGKLGRVYPKPSPSVSSVVASSSELPAC